MRPLCRAAKPGTSLAAALSGAAVVIAQAMLFTATSEAASQRGAYDPSEVHLKWHWSLYGFAAGRSLDAADVNGDGKVEWFGTSGSMISPPPNPATDNILSWFGRWVVM